MNDHAPRQPVPCVRSRCSQATWAPGPPLAPGGDGASLAAAAAPQAGPLRRPRDLTTRAADRRRLPAAGQVAVPLEWAEVGVTSGPQLARMRARNLRPSDFTHPDPAVRLAACEARGDLHAEGQLLAAAYDLARHSDTPGAAGRITPPDRLDNGTRWADLPAALQWAWLDGYGAAHDARTLAMDIAACRDMDWKRLRLADRLPRSLRHGEPLDKTGRTRGVRAAGWRAGLRLDTAA